MTLRHIRRESLPWQPKPDRTECGRSIEHRELISRAEWITTLRERAAEQQDWARMKVQATPSRAAPNICQVCSETAVRWPAWQQDPIAAIGRMVDAVGWAGRDEPTNRLSAELLAIGDMVLADAGTFARLAAAHEQELNSRRGWR